MGYGYGVWYKIESPKIYTLSGHVPHITIKCNMLYMDANKLCNELMCRGLTTQEFNIFTQAIDFNKMYDNDALSGWGYYVAMKPVHYLECEVYSEPYKGDFSYLPHITMEYNGTNKIDYRGKRSIKGSLVVADMRNENPSNWIIYN